MTLIRSMLAGAVLLFGASFAAQAQFPYWANPYYQAPPAPSAWNYDPYTSGLTGCPQWYRDSTTPCPPSYGQPAYRLPNASYLNGY